MIKDLALIAGDFLDPAYPIPKQKQYLLKYFRSEIGKTFVRYWVIFGESDQFAAHTGLVCQKRWMQTMTAKIRILESTYLKARKEMDFSLVAKLETGKFKV